MSQAAEAGQRTDRSSDFSLVDVGPFNRWMDQLRMPGPARATPRRRIAGLLAVVWLPLLALAAAEGRLFGGVGVSFLTDVAAQVRFLVALPLLLVAEWTVHQRMHGKVHEFVRLGMVGPAQMPAFVSAIEGSRRLLSSRSVEAGLVLLIYLVSLGGVMPNETFVAGTSWYGEVDAEGMRDPTLAGRWLALVSLPLFHFLLLRWYFRLLIWWRLLWELSRLELQLQTLHPDRMGGLGFLSRLSTAFAPLLFAQGALTAGLIADQIIYAGATLGQYRVQMAAACLLMMILIVGPLCAFARPMGRAKRESLERHGELSMRYLRAMSRKWTNRESERLRTQDEDSDLQMLSDLGDSFERVERQRVLPLTPTSLLVVVAASLMPMLPLLLTTFSVDEMIVQLIRVLV